jgi:PiT family inorganic phosphate transporter
MPVILFFLSSGLFLGWSLGANDASNVFGTAVASRMIKFSAAAWLCSLGVIVGAFVSGAGAGHTLGKLGSINAMAGAFTVALSSALTILYMTKLSLPVSTSQAIVGSIIGWNIYAGRPTDPAVFTEIASVWVLCPFLAMAFTFVFFHIVKFILGHVRISLFRLDWITRILLIATGVFGSYSLGANNTANVVGAFLTAFPGKDLAFGDWWTLTTGQQLFLLGGTSIAIGVFTYSKKVMMTVGKGIYKLSPVTACLVVLSTSLVLYIFSSSELNALMSLLHLPRIPMVPVSSSQAVVGAVLGIGLAKSARNLNLGLLGKISIGWIATPIMSGLTCYILLYVVQNVFMATVFIP